LSIYTLRFGNSKKNAFFHAWSATVSEELWAMLLSKKPTITTITTTPARISKYSMPVWAFSCFKKLDFANLSTFSFYTA